ncbi:MAG: hypothetical protein ACLFVH_11185 [Phycisphaerae bacterium]
MVYDLRPFIQWVLTEYEPTMRISPGHYRRSLGDEVHELYGTADMACVLFTLGALHPSESERSCWIAAFDAFGETGTGQWLERKPTHAPLHNTAFALAAMNLLGIVPTETPAFAKPFRPPEAIERMLDGLDWQNNVYGGSHRGAGLGAIFTLLPSLFSPDWFARYFARTDALFDAANGMMGVDKPACGDWDQIGGTFHYAFLYEFFHRRMPFPQARVDAILGLQQADGFWHPSNHYWLTLDAVYLLTRSVRFVPECSDAVAAAIGRCLRPLYERIMAPEKRDEIFFGRSDNRYHQLGVHQLTATLSVFAEAQRFLGDQDLITDYPLRLVLDYRPFI